MPTVFDAQLMAIFFLNENTKQTSSMESIVFSQSLEISISIYNPIQIIYAVFLCVVGGGVVLHVEPDPKPIKKNNVEINRKLHPKYALQLCTHIHTGPYGTMEKRYSVALKMRGESGKLPECSTSRSYCL